MDFIGGLQTMFGTDTSGRNRNKNTARGTSAPVRQNELHKKNLQLQEKLDSANDRVVQLENEIHSIKEKNEKAERALETNREDIDQLIEGVTLQVQEMIDSLDLQMKQLESRTDDQIRELTESARSQTEEIRTTSSQLDGIRETIRPMEEIRDSVQQINEIRDSVQQINEIRTMLDGMEKKNASLQDITEKSEALRTDLVEKIHAENVKCFRNMKSLVNDLETRIEEIELSENSLKRIQKSFKGWKVFSFFALADFVLLVVFLLLQMGLISF